jgi:hypothetical protein
MPDTPSTREARLRPEFASRYPGFAAGLWVPAAHAAAWVTQRVGPVSELQQRALSDEHFEFRGGGGRHEELSGSRSRTTDA